MKSEIIQSLISDFETCVHHSEDGLEYWLARELQELLGYSQWRNFLPVLEKARQSCESSGSRVSDHFADIRKMIELGKGGRREIEDVMLTRRACYLIAQNGDPRKEPIAFAQAYFAVQTRRAEIIERRIMEVDRVRARKKLSQTESELSDMIYEQTGSEKNFAIIRSKGDQALFGKSTAAMKEQWGVPAVRPLADFAPTIIIKAKDFASEITIFNAREHKMESESAISGEHVENNEAVRNTLIKRGIKPEKLSPAEDVKKVERRLASEEKKALNRTGEIPVFLSED